MHDRLTRHYRIMLGRILLSVSAFSIFFALSLTLTLSGEPGEHFALATGLFLGAFLALPRRTQPRILRENLEQGALRPEDEERWLDRFQRAQTWVNVTRMVFIFATIFNVVILPELV